MFKYEWAICDFDCGGELYACDGGRHIDIKVGPLRITRAPGNMVLPATFNLTLGRIAWFSVMGREYSSAGRRYLLTLAGSRISRNW